MKPFIPSKAAEFTFGLVIGTFAIIHLLNFEGLEDYVPAYAIRDAKLWIFLAGLVHLFAALCIVTGWKKTEACYILAVMLLILATTIHLRGLFQTKDKAMETVYIMNMMKDTAMAACAIMVGNRKRSTKVVRKKIK